MSETTLFWIKLIAGLAALAYGLIATFTDLHHAGDGKKRLSRKGWAGITFAVLAFLAGAFADSTKDRLDANQRLQEDSLFKHRTDSITHLQIHALDGMDSVRRRAVALAASQSRALLKLDTALAKSQTLSDQQQRVASGLAASLLMSRQIGSQLRAADSVATQRSRLTLSLLELARNPLNEIKVSLEARLPRDARLGDYLAGLQSNVSRIGGVSGRAGVSEEVYHVSHPTLRLDNGSVPLSAPVLTVSFWKSHTSCNARDPRRPDFVRAIAHLRPESLHVGYRPSDTTVVLRWEAQKSDMRTDRNVSVDELRGACMALEFNTIAATNRPEEVARATLSAQIWSMVDVQRLVLYFPQGRYEMLVGVARNEPNLWVERLSNRF